MLATVAACGGSNDGAVLTVRSPDGPATASRIEIVLASADAMTIADIDGQRTMPTMLTVEQARYYRQRATAGFVDDVAKLDGFVVRIEPNLGVSPDEQFIPFLLAYGDGDALIGIGTVRDEAGNPASVVIQAGRSDPYFVDMVPLADTDGDNGIASGESMTIGCAGHNQQPFRSGVAWRPSSGPQLRLLMPDTSIDAKATDATPRSLDLDCDDHDAPDDDCDDLRAAFNNDGAERCDGQDTNCDGARFEIVDCAITDTCGSNTGVQLCLDAGANPQAGQCVGDPKCQCTMGQPGPCTKCILDFRPTSDPAKQTPCAPAVGTLAIAGCAVGSPCTVEVVRRPGPWEGSVSVQPDSGFGQKAVGVTDKVFLEAKLGSGSDVTGMSAESVGAIFLAVSQGTSVRYIGVDLELNGNGAIGACVTTNGTSPMVCGP
jgi:hypothetical protein